MNESVKIDAPEVPAYAFLNPFVWVFGATILWGTFINQVMGAGGDTLFFFGVYALATFFQQLLFGARYFHKGGAVEAMKSGRKEFFLGGRRFDLGGSGAAENATLAEILAASGQVKIRLFVVTILVICVGAMMTHEIHFQISILFHFFTAVTFVMAMNVNHFVVPLGINLLGVLYGSLLETAPPNWTYLPYGFLLAATFCLYRQLELETLFPAEVASRSPARRRAAYLAAAWTIAIRGAGMVMLLVGVGLTSPSGEGDANTAKDPIRDALTSAFESVAGSPRPSDTSSPTSSPTPSPLAATPSSTSRSLMLVAARLGRPTPSPSPSPGQPESSPDTSGDLGSWIGFALLGFLAIAGLGRRLLYRQRFAARKLAPKIREELRAEFRRINVARLDSHELVVARYALFLKVMEAADSPKGAHVSPTDYLHGLKYVYPKIEFEATVLTEIFSDAYYGGLPVADGPLESSRRALQTLFRHFHL